MTANAKHSRAQILLDFWFGPSSDPSSYGKEKRHWWSSTPSIDQQIKAQFESDHLLAAAGELDDWKSDAYSCLALILLLDQIPRNIYRNTAQAFSTGHKALDTAKYAVEHGFDQQLRLKVEKKFVYMPFNHAEDLQAQAQAKELFQVLGEDSWNWYAEHYYGIIQRFGRFPHRNRVLDRENTKEESDWLRSNN